MEIVFNEKTLRHYIEKAEEISPKMPILVDSFLEDAIEAEADAVSDGRDAFVPSVMQHIEFAGIHSGDSACVIPPVIITDQQIEIIKDYTRRIAVRFGVVGLMNIQYAILKGKVYILEANPRASRTVPIVSKVCGFSMVRIASRLALGEKIADMDLKEKKIRHFGVKESVFPFNMFQEVDPLLGPEMRSTGEVLALAGSYPLAFFKAQEAVQQPLPVSGCVLITVAKRDKAAVLPAALTFFELGFSILSTEGTADFLRSSGIECRTVKKFMKEGPISLMRLKTAMFIFLLIHRTGH
jgi:carbamoyl-phosphate synthase large subunit